jgi:hypothetical protein
MPPGPVQGAHPAGSSIPKTRPEGGRQPDLAGGRPPLALPPAPMPGRQRSRPLKRWCYVGIFGPELMFCVGTAAVGPLAQAFWALWDRRTGLLDTDTRFGGPRLRGHRISVDPRGASVHSGAARLEVALTVTGEAVEVVSPHGRSYIWTRKVPVRADGHLAIGMDAHPVTGHGILDESAGYHARDTEWEWSAGVGRTVDGWPVTWNLVRGLHDAETRSERTVWVQGRASEVPAVRFSTELDELWSSDGSVLRFDEEATRSRRDNFGLVRSDYVQPFGRFEGTLPGGIELSDQEPALGVMERHRARW